MQNPPFRAARVAVHLPIARAQATDPMLARGAQALNKVLDRKHEAIVRRFGRVPDAESLATLWQEADQSGEVPGAYWAVLTHRRVTPDLRQHVFGDVHMLSHLVGAANRADLRRLAAIDHDNDELQQRKLRQQERIEELARERDQGLASCERLRLRVEELALARSIDGASAQAGDAAERDALTEGSPAQGAGPGKALI